VDLALVAKVQQVGHNVPTHVGGSLGDPDGGDAVAALLRHWG
jgi:hypothetical protein